MHNLANIKPPEEDAKPTPSERSINRNSVRLSNLPTGQRAGTALPAGSRGGVSKLLMGPLHSPDVGPCVGLAVKCIVLYLCVEFPAPESGIELHSSQYTTRYSKPVARSEAHKGNDWFIESPGGKVGNLDELFDNEELGLQVGDVLDSS